MISPLKKLTASVVALGSYALAFSWCFGPSVGSTVNFDNSCHSPIVSQSYQSEKTVYSPSSYVDGCKGSSGFGCNDCYTRTLTIGYASWDYVNTGCTGYVDRGLRQTFDVQEGYYLTC